VAIRRSEDIVTASKLGLPVSCFARKNSNAIEDIIQIVQEVIKGTSTDMFFHKGVEGA
jgi:hypothetical protein